MRVLGGTEGCRGMKWRMKKHDPLGRLLGWRIGPTPLSKVEALISPVSIRFGLWGVSTWVSDLQPDPLDTLPSPVTAISTLRLGYEGQLTTVCPNSQSDQTNIAPEQDLLCDSQEESSGDSSEMNSEDTQSRGSSPLSYDLNEQGHSLT